MRLLSLLSLPSLATLRGLNMLYLKLWMLCNLYFVSLLEDGSKASEELVESNVDLDYWNIRQWRRLYLLLSQANETRYTKLDIRPQYHKSKF